MPSIGDKDWWSQTGSNRRPPACKAGALPAELWPPSGDALYYVVAIYRGSACYLPMRGAGQPFFISKLIFWHSHTLQLNLVAMARQGHRLVYH